MWYNAVNYSNNSKYLLGGEKVRIQFEFTMTKLPIGYRLGMLSIIKEMVRSGSVNYYHHIFNENKHEIKPFVHSTYIKNVTLKENEIHGERLHLTISSPSHEFMMYLINGSKKLESYEYKGYKLVLKQKRLLPKPPEFTELVTFSTASPLLIENKYGKPLLANDPAFETEFNYYANLVATELYQRKLFKPIEIVKSSMKKVVLKEKLHHDDDNDIFITTNHGLLTLKGHPNDLKMIYESGIGRRRSLGLGLLNIKGVDYSSWNK